MKTTIDLPDDLVRIMKLKAVREDRKLKDVAAEVFRLGLSRYGGSTEQPSRRKVQLPLIKAAPGTRLFELSGERIHELEMESEIEGHDSSGGQ